MHTSAYCLLPVAHLALVYWPLFPVPHQSVGPHSLLPIGLRGPCWPPHILFAGFSCWPWQKLGKGFKRRLRANEVQYGTPISTNYEPEVGDVVVIRCDIEGETDQVDCKGTVLEVAVAGGELTVNCPALDADATVSRSDVVEVVANANSVSPVPQGNSLGHPS